jgi:hypothetical protein
MGRTKQSARKSFPSGGYFYRMKKKDKLRKRILGLQLGINGMKNTRREKLERMEELEIY